GLALDILVGVDGWTDGEDPRGEQLTGIGEVGERENVRVRLWLASRRDSVRERGFKRPGAAIAGTRASPVRVPVDEAWGDCIAVHVDDAGAGRDCDRSGCSNGRDAVAANDDVATLDDLVSFDGQESRAAKHDCPRGSSTRTLDHDVSGRR